MAVARDPEQPIASAKRGIASGLFVIDQDLLICQVSPGGADVFGAEDDELTGRSILDHVGPSAEMRSLQGQLQGRAEAEPLHWQAEANGRRFYIRGTVDYVSAASSERFILLKIWQVAEEASTRYSVLPAAITDERAWSARLYSYPGVLLILTMAVGLGFAISNSESRPVDGGAVEDEIVGRSPKIDPFSEEPPRLAAGDLSIRRLSGQVLPATSVVGVAPFDGTITDVSAPSFGVAVEKGDLLVTIDSGEEGNKALREARISLIEARSELVKLENWSTGTEMREAERSLNEAKHTLQLATIEQDRTKMLLDEGIIAVNEYEGAVESVRSARLQMVSAKERHEEVVAQAKGELLEIAKERFSIARTEYELLQAARNDSEVRAPISGVLLPAPAQDEESNELSVGRQVEKGASLLVIGSNNDLVVQTSVSEFDVDLIKEGQKASITSPAAPDFRLKGHVQSIALISSAFGQEDSNSVSYTVPPARYEVTIKITTRGKDLHDSLRIGMTVDAEIDTAAPLVAKR